MLRWLTLEMDSKLVSDIDEFILTLCISFNDISYSLFYLSMFYIMHHWDAINYTTMYGQI